MPTVIPQGLSKNQEEMYLREYSPDLDFYVGMLTNLVHDYP
jgi:hypothetical protein